MTVLQVVVVAVSLTVLLIELIGMETELVGAAVVVSGIVLENNVERGSEEAGSEKMEDVKVGSGVLM